MVDAKAKKKRVLMIDDEVDLLEIMGAHLESWGYEVVRVSNGDDALKALAEEKPDVIVLDYIMPDINGVELLKKIRRVNTDIPVIMFTAKPESEAIKESKKLNISAFVPKLSPYVDTRKGLKSALSMALKLR